MVEKLGTCVPDHLSPSFKLPTGAASTLISEFPYLHKHQQKSKRDACYDSLLLPLKSNLLFQVSVP